MPSALGPRERTWLDGAQTVEVEDMDELAVRQEQTFCLKTRERPADRFERDAEETAHVLARETQVEFVARVTPVRQPGGNIEQQRGDATRVTALVEALQAERVTAEMQAHDIFAAIRARDGCLDRAGADGVKRI